MEEKLEEIKKTEEKLEKIKKLAKKNRRKLRKWRPIVQK